jgi:hypothetical protein
MTLGTPQDVTLQELLIETFFPADEASERILRSMAQVNGRWILLRTMSDRALFRAARTCTDRTGDSRTLWLGVSRHET